MVSDEYARIMREGKQRVLISSCCPSINMLIQKYYPRCFLIWPGCSPPCRRTARPSRSRIRRLSPCFDRPLHRQEGPRPTTAPTPTTSALTYDELRDWLTAEHIELPVDHVAPTDGKRSRLYPATGGVLKATDRVDGYRRIAIDGVDNCRAVFDELENSQFGNVFIEMSACEGSCVNGPCIREHAERRLKGALRVDNFAGDQRFDDPAPADISHSYAFLGGKKVKFGSEAISDMLYKWARPAPKRSSTAAAAATPPAATRPSPFWRARPRSKCACPSSRRRPRASPTASSTTPPTPSSSWDEDLVVQQINRAALRMFKLKDASDILHEHVVRILNPGDYQNIITSALHTTTRMHYLADYQLYVDETILYDRQYHIVISLMRDVTEQETLRGSGRGAAQADGGDHRQGDRKADARGAGDRHAPGRDHRGNQDCPHQAKGCDGP